MGKTHHPGIRYAYPWVLVDGAVRAAPLLARQVRSMAELIPRATDDWSLCWTTCLGPERALFPFSRVQEG